TEGRRMGFRGDSHTASHPCPGEVALAGRRQRVAGDRVAEAAVFSKHMDVRTPADRRQGDREVVSLLQPHGWPFSARSGYAARLAVFAEFQSGLRSYEKGQRRLGVLRKSGADR